MKKFLTFLSKVFLIYAFSGGLYLLIETLWRGYTYLEMYYLAGFLGVIAYFINNTKHSLNFYGQVIIMTIISTFGEGLVGNIFNKDYHIWDYRNLPLSFWNDQCNGFFVICWMILFIIGIPLLDYIGWKCWNEPKPNYFKRERVD